MSSPTPSSASSDDQKIRDLIDTWAAASADGDLIALTNLMTEDVVFLTSGQPPMSRKAFAESFTQAIQSFTLAVRPNIQEITISGDLAICWNLLEVDITPSEGGTTIKRAGNILTAFRRGADGQWRVWRDANLVTMI
jgi:uncharacterized protein (TIGR02246 family)